MCVSVYLSVCLSIVFKPSPPTADATDRPFLLDQEQFVIWSMGPVSSLVTPLSTTIPVPFRHFIQPSRAGTYTYIYHNESNYSTPSFIQTTTLSLNFHILFKCRSLAEPRYNFDNFIMLPV